MSSSDIISQLVQQLQDAGGTDNALIWKKLTILSVNKVLHDVSQLTDARLPEHIETSLDFIQNALSQYPEIFIPNLILPDVTSGDDVKAENHPNAAGDVRGSTSTSSANQKASKESSAESVNHGNKSVNNAHGVKEAKQNEADHYNKATDSCWPYLCISNMQVDCPHRKLTRWVICRVLSILSAPHLGSLKSKTKSLILAILHAAKLHNIPFYGELISELIFCLNDLLINFRSYFENLPVEVPAKLRRFWNVNVAEEVDSGVPINTLAELESYELLNRGIILPDSNWCQQLQVAICEILCEITVDVTLYGSHNVKILTWKELVTSYKENRCAEPLYHTILTSTDVLWLVVSDQLEYGEVDLKTASLELFLSMLKLQSPPIDMLMRFIDLFLDLLDLIFSEFSDCDGNFVALEKACAEMLTELGRRKLCLQGCRHELARIVMSNGIGKVRTEDLKVATVSCLATSVYNDGNGNTPSTIDSNRKLCNFLLDELCSATTKSNLIYLCPLFSALVYQDLRCLESGNVSLKSIPSSDKHSKFKLSTASHGLDACQISLEEVSSTATLMFERLDRLSAMLSESRDVDYCLMILKAINVILRSLDVLSSQAKDGCNSVLSQLGQNVTVVHLTHNQNSKLISNFIACLSVNCISADTNCMAKYFDVVVSCLSVLVTHSFSGNDNQLLNRIAGILSIPWLCTEASWLDLGGGEEMNLLVKVSEKLVEVLEEETLCACLHELSQLRRSIAAQWRIKVLRLAVGSARETVRSQAVQCIPNFVCTFGSNFRNVASDILLELLKDKSIMVLETLAKTMGPLTCSFLGKVSLLSEWKSNFEDFVLLCSEQVVRDRHWFLYDKLLIDCNCGRLTVNKPDASCKDSELTVPSFILPVLKQLATSEVAAVKVHLIRNFDRIFGHISNTRIMADSLKHVVSLLDDENTEVRMEFSRSASHLICSSGSPEAGKCNKILSKQFSLTSLQYTEPAGSTSFEAKLVTTLAAAGEVSKLADDDLMLAALVIILNSVFFPVSELVENLARDWLMKVAACRHMTMARLFARFDAAVCKAFVECLHETKSAKPDWDLGVVLERIAEIFEFTDVQTFLRNNEKLLLPHLILKATTTSSALLRYLAQQMSDPNHKNPIIRTIVPVFCHVICSCPQSGGELERVLKYLETETGWTLDQILRTGEHTDSRLLLHIGSHREQVLNGLRIWLAACGTAVGSCDADLADHLQPNILGTLVHFDRYLNDTATQLTDKRKAFASLISFVKLMGRKHITRVRMRVMATLRISLRFKEDEEFADLSCEAWTTFVHLLDATALGPMLSQIVVALLPLFACRPSKVASIMQFLIINNEKELSSHFHELHFLPEAGELVPVLNVLRKYVSDDATDVRKEAVRLMNGVVHEAPEVRQMALVKLRRWLRCNRPAIQALVLGGSDTSADPLISDVVGALLKGCLESDVTSKALYGECLGELGAIDPGRLALTTNRPREELSKFTASMIQDEFVFQLINELTKAFIRAEDRIKDSVAFALQEIIQMFNIRPADPNSDEVVSSLWSRFSVVVQDILSPFIHSRYCMNIHFNWAGLVLPIFNGKKGNTFELWIRTFACYIGSKIQDDKCRKIYEACRGVIRQDSQMALYVLPYLVVQVLMDGDTDDREMLFNEMSAVLTRVQEPDSQSGTLSDRNHMSAQTVFSILDHITKFCRYRFLVLSSSKSAPRNLSAVQVAQADRVYMVLKGFIDRVPQDVLSQASYNCGAYARALMYHEQYMKRPGAERTTGDDRIQRSSDQSERSDLDALLSLYVALDEPDCVAGVVAVQRTQPSLSQQIAALESVGKLSDAAVCYDRAMQMSPNDVALCRGRLQNCLALGELSTVHHLANDMIAGRPMWKNDLNTFRIEASWKLSQWDKLTEYLNTGNGSRSPSSSSSTVSQDWNVSISSLLLAIKNRDEETFGVRLTRTRRELIGPLSAACMESGSYQRGYEYIVRLHMLAELEEFARLICRFELPNVGTNSFNVTSSEASDLDLSALMTQWNSRLEFSQFSYRTRAPILDLRRTMLRLAHEDSPHDASISRLIGQCWLDSARVARECGLIQTAHSSLLSAAECELPDYCLEKSHWLWARGECEAARFCLEHELEVSYPDRVKVKDNVTASGTAGALMSSMSSTSLGSAVGSWSQSRRQMCAKVMLQLACYSEETASCESNAIIRQFRAVKDVYLEWEDGHYRTAMYFDKIMMALAEGELSDRRGDFVLQVVNHFGQSLIYGSQYIYQSMPRMLTLWLDYGAELASLDDGRSDAVKQTMRVCLGQLNKLMSSFASRLSSYQFLVAFPQLISRICHTHPEVFAQLREIIANLLREFQQQSIWMMMAVSKSSYQMRAKRCQEIFARAKVLNPDLNKFLADAIRLTDRLLELCNKSVEGAPSTNSLRISVHFKPLQRLLEDPNFSLILLPLQSQMEPSLPSALVTPSKHLPFPVTQVYIQGIEDVVDVLTSLQRPKKIQFRGTDGRTYPMLCKPKDDLRKDGRLMEFTGVVNRCLKRNPDSRRRNLCIRTFAVTPLNEECGLLEWVPNTTGLRPILLKMYKERGLYMSGREVGTFQLKPTDPRDQKLAIYREKLLPRHPAIFGEWFLKTFPDPTAWYSARLIYCRSAAVMSMVGYILGLGDRHGENILLDSTTGDCVHVDFNCLFNKGETFDYPEIVPFRLTHNMVEAMGPLGHEGVFRRSCEVTLRVMRDQTDPLMSVLKTFIFDPLVEWSKPTRGRNNPTESGEIRNEKAQTHVNNIEDRLRGIMKVKAKPKGLPLSVEGHVSHLIQEATDVNNLCQMYVGWAAYM